MYIRGVSENNVNISRVESPSKIRLKGEAFKVLKVLKIGPFTLLLMGEKLPFFFISKILLPPMAEIRKILYNEIIFVRDCLC